MKNRTTATAALSLALAAGTTAPAQSVFATGTTIWDATKTWTRRTPYAAPNGEAVLVDMDGTVFHKWVSPVPGEGLGLVEPLEKGNILCVTRPPGSLAAATVLELNWSGGVVWSFTMPPGGSYIHHEIERLPNGNTLLLCAQTITVPMISTVPLIDDFLIEVSPTGQIVWSWFTWQHFNQFGFDATAKSLIAAAGGDWAHTNAASPLPDNSHGSERLRPGNILVSQRHTNTLYIIDRKSGDVVWSLGPNDNLTHGQHAPYMIDPSHPGAGNILVFDNGSGTGYPLKGRAQAFARVLEINPASKQIAWDYDASDSGLFPLTFRSDIISNAERLANGNTLICSGVRGRLFEVTTTGEIVWEYVTPYTGQLGNRRHTLVYRAYRVDSRWLPFAWLVPRDK